MAGLANEINELSAAVTIHHRHHTQRGWRNLKICIWCGSKRPGYAMSVKN